MRLECYCIRGGNYARNGGRGGGLDRVSRAGRANSSGERERERELARRERKEERERESIANKRTSRRNDDGEGRDDRDFFLDSKGNDTRTDMQLLVAEEV